jgi:hypothetical protein
VFDFFALSFDINVEADFIFNSFSAWDGGLLLVQLAQMVD